VAYERPALSKAYLFPEGPARLPGFHTTVGGGGERQDPAWYAAHGIAYLVNTRVTAADLAAKALSTAAGGSITYDTLLVGTGARPTNLADFGTPGAGLKGILYLRNVADADALVAALAEVKAGGGAVTCIGGGYIGMETAAAIALHGVPVTMVFPESRMFARLFTPELSAFYEGFYESKGVRLLRGALAQGFEGDADGRVAATLLKGGGRVEGSLVVVGVGARPNTELFKGQLEMLDGPPGGIKVDGRMATSVPGVYAVGDVAAFPLKVAGGGHTRQEHVTNARLSAAHAMADAMAPGSAGEYDYQPFFYSRVFSLSWQFYGQSKGEVTHFGDLKGGKFGAYWVEGGKVVGAFLESGTDAENAAINKVAAAQPQAPADLGTQGLAFASKL
jgi:monodehydroascorbate reductase (NADH)